MSDEKEIPVCTVFNQPDDASAGNGDFLSSLSSGQEDSKDVQEVELSTGAEASSSGTATENPVVCQLFSSNPSTDDLFAASIISSFASDQPEGVPQSISTNLPKIDIQESVDQSIKSPSDQQDLTDVFNKILAEDRSLSEATESTLDVITGKSDQVTLNTSNVMDSILISGDSCDDISNIPFDQTTKPEDKSIEADSTLSNSTSQNEIQKTNALVFEENNEKLLDNKHEQTVGVAEKDETFVSTDTSEKNVLAQTADVEDSTTERSNLNIANNIENVVLQSAITSDATKTKISTTNRATSEEEVYSPKPLIASELFSNADTPSPFDTFARSLSSAEEEDAFMNALHSSEVDRRRDAWLPNESTKAVLTAVVQSQKRINLEPKHLTRPGLVTSESLGDPTKALLARIKALEGLTQRQTLTADDVLKDRSGLQKLVNTGNLRAAADLCGKVLADLGQGFGCATQESTHSALSLQWWQVRFSLLLRLKMYELAVPELEQFGTFETADLYYEFYPDLYPGRKGSMVPFSLRLLYADFPRHLNKPNEALQRLYAMQSVCDKIIKNLKCGKAEDGTAVDLKQDDKTASIKLWNERKVQVLYCTGNTLLQLREYHGAINVYDGIVELCPGNAVLLISGIGRVLLQLGDIKEAQRRFAQVEKLAENEEKYQIQLILNRGFLYVGANNWKEALNQFSEVLKIDPLHFEALNNKSVCLLFLCRLREAIAVQEQTIQLKNETKLIQIHDSPPLSEVTMEGALANLVTLYELESSKCVSKKEKLLEHVSARNGDGFNVACLKLA